MSSCRASWLLSRLNSHCPLVLSSRRHLLFPPRLSLSSRCTALIVSLRRLVVVASPLVAPPSRPLVTPPSRPLVALHSRPLIILSLAALSPSHRAVWLLRRFLSRCHLVLLSSSHCAALPSSNRAGWLLRRLSLCRRLVLSSRRPLVLLSSSHCAAFSSSHRTVCLLRPLSSRRRFVLSSSSHCATLSSSCVGWLLCCLSLRLSLVLSSCCPLVLSLCAG